MKRLENADIGWGGLAKFALKKSVQRVLNIGDGTTPDRQDNPTATCFPALDEITKELECVCLYYVQAFLFLYSHLFGTNNGMKATYIESIVTH